MTPLEIVRHFKGQEPLWPDLADKLPANPEARHGAIERVAVLDEGTTGGSPSLMIAIRLDDGTYTFAETTARLWRTASGAIDAWYPDR